MKKHWFYAPGTTSVRGKWIEINVDHAKDDVELAAQWLKYDEIANHYAAKNQPMLVFPPKKQMP
jgi:hypothetical protein